VYCQHRVSAVSCTSATKCPVSIVCQQRLSKCPVSIVCQSALCVSRAFQSCVSTYNRVSQFTLLTRPSRRSGRSSSSWTQTMTQDAYNDTDLLTDVEYDNERADSDAGGETPGSSLAAAGTSSRKRALEVTPLHQRNPKAGTRTFSHWCGNVVCAPATDSSALWQCPEQQR
jgi:hypothetical protein